MHKLISLFIIFLFLGNPGFSQGLPIIRSNSKVADIRDGDDFQKGNWNIFPEVKPDIYHVERFKGRKKVTFITDIDSISFDVEPQKNYNFIILLNGKDTAYTQLSTITPAKLKYTSKYSNHAGQTDSIPFTVGWNNSIKVKGKINNSEALDLIFDTGANGFVLSSDAISKKLNIKIDGEIKGFGLGGVSNDKVSNNNRLEISGLKWDSVNILVKYQGKPNADGVIGYNVFDGKIVEIDYEKKIMVIHSKLPNITGYTKHPLQFKGGLSFIELTLDNGKSKTTGWFDFDTGSSSTLFVSHDFTASRNFFSYLKRNGSDNIKGSGPNKIRIDHLVLPKLLIGGTELKNISIDAEAGNSGTAFNIVGNDVLKRFNVIIDYQDDVVYLKPNTLIDNMYLSQKIEIIKWSAGLLICILLVAAFIFYRKRKLTRKKITLKPAQQQ